MNEDSLDILFDWLEIYIENPRATSETKEILASKCNLSVSQVSSWINRTKKTTDYQKIIERNNRKKLKEVFLKNQYPDKKEIQELLSITNLSEKKLKSWFAWERYKYNHYE